MVDAKQRVLLNKAKIISRKVLGLRKKPYTENGINRLKCFRCNRKAKFQWNICADDNTYRPICIECDIKLNKLVLKFMGFKDWRNKMKRYLVK